MTSTFRFGPRWISTSLVLLLALWILRGFLVPLTWAVIIALATWPLYRRFSTWLPQRFSSNGIPLLFTALVTLFVVGPFGFAFVAVGTKAQAWAHEFIAADNHGISPPDWLTAIPLAGSWVLEQWNAILGTPGGASRWLHRAEAASLLGWAGSLGQFILHHTMIVAVTVLALFFLYRGGEPLAGRITQFIHDKLGQRADSYFLQATKATRAIMGGMIVVALINGVLVGLAYAVAHVPSPEFWGAITGLLAMIPFLAYFVVAGVALMLFAKGAGAAAVAVFVWGVTVVFVADNFIRPALAGSATGLGFFWVLLGGLGGLETFGLLGLIIGPVILALAGALWRDSVDGAV